MQGKKESHDSADTDQENCEDRRSLDRMRSRREWEEWDPFRESNQIWHYGGEGRVVLVLGEMR